MESCSQRRWDGFTAVTVIERDWMGLWGRKVCDNLASKRDTESIPSQSSHTEITGLDQETHKTWDHSFHISAWAPEFSLIRLNSCQKCQKSNILWSQTFIHLVYILQFFNFILPKILIIKKSILWASRPLSLLRCQDLRCGIKLYFHPVADCRNTISDGTGWIKFNRKWDAPLMQILILAFVVASFVCFLPFGKQLHKVY